MNHILHGRALIARLLPVHKHIFPRPVLVMKGTVFFRLTSIAQILRYLQNHIRALKTFLPLILHRFISKQRTEDVACHSAGRLAAGAVIHRRKYPRRNHRYIGDYNKSRWQALLPRPIPAADSGCFTVTRPVFRKSDSAADDIDNCLLKQASRFHKLYGHETPHPRCHGAGSYYSFVLQRVLRYNEPK